MSAQTSFAPNTDAGSFVAMHVIGVTITSSPGPMSQSLNASVSADVQLFTREQFSLLT